MINELLNLVFNTNIVLYPSIGMVLLLYHIAEFPSSMVLVLHCMQKASIAHHWYTLLKKHLRGLRVEMLQINMFVEYWRIILAI